MLRPSKSEAVIGALVLGVMLFVACALALGWLPTHVEYCEQPHQTNHKECATYHIALVATWQIGKLLDAIAVPLTALATVAIGYFTFTLKASTDRLWIAGEKARKLSGDTAKRQLRAYIFSDHAKVIGFNTNSHILVTAAFKNSGQTPAYNVIVWVNCHIAAYPLEGKRERPTDESGASRGHVGPGATFHVPMQLSETKTASQTAAIRAGVGAIYYYGEVTYIDAFWQARFTRFCFMYGGDAGCNSEGVMATYGDWNEAN
jgi:hypothetical protein